MRVALHDKLSALDKLCRMFGLYSADDPDPSKTVAELSDIERTQRIAAILKLRREAKQAETETCKPARPG